MKLIFKHQEYQEKAVKAVTDCFEGQPKDSILRFRQDPGITKTQVESAFAKEGFRNRSIEINDADLLKNIQKVQQDQNLRISEGLFHFMKYHDKKKDYQEATKKDIKLATDISKYNLDVEMETGTGKTYVYIKTIFELNKLYGWSKFIVVVPSIAIREGVYKTLEITQDHFKGIYQKTAKYFIYNSKQLHNLEAFSSDAGINIMVINVQAFNAAGKDNRRIYEELDSFNSRRPIDVIKANKPILILDEPQKMEGERTLQSLVEFNPLFVLRYSATHKTVHNKIHRLDALDAYNQKLVKKIAVRGITTIGLTGTTEYLYLESVDISKQAPIAKMKFEQKQNNGIRQITRNCRKGDNLFDHSNQLQQYKAGYVISEINAVTNTVEFTNGVKLAAGQLCGRINDTLLRRIQIRETINAHLEKEASLFDQGIKVLSLFFIDEVAKYREYDDNNEAQKGEYAKIFEEEYDQCLIEAQSNIFLSEKYRNYLDGILADKTHNGYFSIDKKGGMFNWK